MTPSEILFLANFLQNYTDNVSPSYEGTTFGEWEISDREFFIDTVCYVVEATVTKYFELDTAQHEHFGTPCTETYATNEIVTIDSIMLLRLEDDGNTTKLAVPTKLLEKQLS